MDFILGDGIIEQIKQENTKKEVLIQVSLQEAALHVENGQLEQALHVYQGIIDNNPSLNIQNSTYVKIGEIYQLLGDHQQAIFYFFITIQYFIEKEYHSLAVETYMSIIRSFEVNGDCPNVLKYVKLAKDLIEVELPHNIATLAVINQQQDKCIDVLYKNKITQIYMLNQIIYDSDVVNQLYKMITDMSGYIDYI